MSHTYAITAATGNIGRPISEFLLSQGHQVRVLTRNSASASDLAQKGAQVYEGAPDDIAVLTSAFQGCDAVFTLIPVDMQAADMRVWQNRVGSSQAEAISAAGVTRVVNLSSVGAHLSAGVGPIKGLYDQEQRLNALPIQVVHLRPAYFMENLFLLVDLLVQQRIVGSPLPDDFRTPMIATRDIAARAADLLDRLAVKGQTTQELLGQRDVSYGDITAVLGRLLAMPKLAYVQFPYDDAQAAMEQVLSKDYAAQLIELYRALAEGLLQPLESRNPQNTTPTSIEAFLPALAEAVKAQRS